MKWTEEFINILKEGVENKLTFNEISEIIGVGKNAVRLKAQKLNLKSKYFERLDQLSETKDCEKCNKSFESLISENRKFCSKSCSASASNIGINRYKNISKKFLLKGNCKNCNSDIEKGIYCSRKCHREYEYNIRIEQWKQGEIVSFYGKTKSLANWLRKYILDKYDNSCQKCGWNELHPVDRKPLVEINHIDGNAENNKEENLEVLCPNCHSMTPNFRARNKISTRNRK